MTLVIDTSAVAAIAFGEPERDTFNRLAAGASRNLMSALTVFECRVVIATRKGAAMVATFEQFLTDYEVEVVAFDAALSKASFDAYLRYGKGVHPKARLSLCDCAAYALAKSRNAPLLFKGDDFPHTDIAPAG